MNGLDLSYREKEEKGNERQLREGESVKIWEEKNKKQKFHNNGNQNNSNKSTLQISLILGFAKCSIGNTSFNL